ncbi:MAG: peptidase M23 [Gammaproteobacteria bacterium]|nr:MAG: peptidase M23 [Gammaproteobacteria bacterium]
MVVRPVSREEHREEPVAGEVEEENWTGVSVRPGDNLALIFKRMGLSAGELQRILALGDKALRLRHLMPGEKLRFLIDDQGLAGLVYEPSPTYRLHLRRAGQEYTIREETREPERRLVERSGIIDDSLFLSAQAAGLSDNLIMQLTEIFGWDIDFALDIRKGDSYAVVFEELWLDGRKFGDGRILAARFTNQGHGYQALRYTDPKGYTDYYDPEGHSLRKAFLRTPVKFSRISSRFNLKRRHPILNRIRAHKGVDYAAPIGTPVKATGDGKVVFAGGKGGYGKVVIIQHGGVYSTLYGHLHRFARGIRRGKRVRQGQVIAYVGKSGLATGPHLHYEFRVNGVHKDPLKVRLPRARPLPRDYLTDFRAKTAPLLARLEQIDGGRRVAALH